jgi:hypothetical protein
MIWIKGTGIRLDKNFAVQIFHDDGGKHASHSRHMFGRGVRLLLTDI